MSIAPGKNLKSKVQKMPRPDCASAQAGLGLVCSVVNIRFIRKKDEWDFSYIHSQIITKINALGAMNDCSSHGRAIVRLGDTHLIIH